MASPASLPSPALRAILYGGLLAGLGDMLFAFFFYGWRLGIFQTVLGGLIGGSVARQGGVPAFVAGLGLHYLIGIIWAALFWVLSRRLPALITHAVPAGLIYGLIVFYGMNCVVLPLSALQTKAWPPPFALWPIAAHVFLVGLPIALLARRYLRRA
jgi:hypothetical protein